MSRMTSHGVETMLRSWADAQAPVASPALASFMGPLVPLPALATSAGGLGGGAASAGISTKVIAGIAAMAVTGAAAYGVNHLRNVSTEQPRPPQSSAPVVPGVGDDSEAPAPAVSSSLPTPTESESESASAEPEPIQTATRTAAPEPTRSTSPREETTEAADSGDDEHSDGPSSKPTSEDHGDDHPSPKPSSPEGTQSTGTDPEPTATPAPTATQTPTTKPSPSASPTRTKPVKGNGSMGDDDHDH